MVGTANVLLVILDSLRAKNMSLYGYGRETTPFLNDFATQSTLYTQARAPSIHSIASHTSMFTGKHPEEHGAVRHTAQIDTGHTVWEELQSDGYETGLFTNNRIISEASNIGDSFGRNYTPHYPLRRRLEESSPLFPEAYSSSEGDISGIAGNVLRSLRDEHKLRSLLNCTYEKLGGIASRAEQRYLNPDSGFKTIVGKRFTDAFLEWESQRSGPWAACVNLMDTHEPYEPLPEFDKWGDDEAWQTQHNHLPLALSEVLQGFGQDLEWEDISALESLYDGTILQADTFVSELIDTLRERGVLEETLVIITSDHGEGLGERSRIDPDVRLKNHLFGLHETLTHVPLVIQYPGQSGGSVVEQAVSLTHLPDLIRAVVRDDTATDPLARARRWFCPRHSGCLTRKQRNTTRSGVSRSMSDRGGVCTRTRGRKCENLHKEGRITLRPTSTGRARSKSSRETPTPECGTNTVAWTTTTF